MIKEMNSFGKTSEAESETLKKQQDRQNAIEIIAKVDPLDDKAFKKFIEDDYWFIQVAELILNRPLPDKQIVSIQGEMALSVNGKLIRMDNLRSSSTEVINMEAQSKAAAFSYKRHLYYGALAYAFTLKEGDDCKELKPTTSIALYKDRGSANLLESAQMQGTLIHDPTERNLLTLVAVNVKKWADASNPALKQLLAVMSNGVYTKEKSTVFAGVDVNSASFDTINKAITIATAIVKYNDFKERGNIEMERKLAGFLSEEDTKTFETVVLKIKELENKNKELVNERKELERNSALALLKTGIGEDAIAKLLKISPERVQQIKKEAKI